MARYETRLKAREHSQQHTREQKKAETYDRNMLNMSEMVQKANPWCRAKEVRRIVGAVTSEWNWQKDRKHPPVRTHALWKSKRIGLSTHPLPTEPALV